MDHLDQWRMEDHPELRRDGPVQLRRAVLVRAARRVSLRCWEGALPHATLTWWKRKRAPSSPAAWWYAARMTPRSGRVASQRAPGIAALPLHCRRWFDQTGAAGERAGRSPCV